MRAVQHVAVPSAITIGLWPAFPVVRRREWFEQHSEGLSKGVTWQIDETETFDMPDAHRIRSKL